MPLSLTVTPVSKLIQISHHWEPGCSLQNGFFFFFFLFFHHFGQGLNNASDQVRFPSAFVGVRKITVDSFQRIYIYESIIGYLRSTGQTSTKGTVLDSCKLVRISVVECEMNCLAGLCFWIPKENWWNAKMNHHWTKMPQKCLMDWMNHSVCFSRQSLLWFWEGVSPNGDVYDCVSGVSSWLIQ